MYIDTQAPQLDQGCVTLSTGADGRTTLGMQVSDEHLYLDTEIFVANDDGTISTSSEKLLHKLNVGLADMPDVTSDAMSVDVTDYAGKLPVCPAVRLGLQLRRLSGAAARHLRGHHPVPVRYHRLPVHR